MPDTEMVKVADYCSVIKGKIGIKKALKGKYPLVTTAEDRLSHNEYHFDRPSVIIPLVSSTGHGHASLKRIHYQEGKFAVGSILCAVTPKDENILNAQFLYHYLDVYKEKLLVSRMRGMANVTLSVTEIEDVVFPLLSTDKQKEWVSLFENASSYTNSLTLEIDYQQSLLKKLRQSILQDGISGKLTEKWRRENPDVEPATELLARIKTEKERLVKEKKIKKEKSLPHIAKEEIPFELPEGWIWCRLRQLPIAVEYGTSSKTSNMGNVCVFAMGHIQDGKLNHGNFKYITDSNKDLPRLYLKHNDLLFNRTNSWELVGKTAVYKGADNEYSFASYLIRLQFVYCNADFYNYVLNSQYFRESQIEPQLIKQCGQANFNGTKLQNSIVPLPPHKEFDVIVSKVEKLFSHCDQLEQQISKSQQGSELLMQAVLKEAFES